MGCHQCISRPNENASELNNPNEKVKGGKLRSYYPRNYGNSGKESSYTTKVIVEGNKRTIISHYSSGGSGSGRYNYDDYGSSSSSKYKKEVNVQTLRNEALSRINEYRSMHQASSVRYNSTINSLAQKHAEYLARRDTLQYSDNTYNGDDLGEIVSSRTSIITGRELIDYWYQDGRNHDYSNNRGKASNFAQLVWKSTKDFGLGAALSSNGNYYFVGNFYPAGNVSFQFKKNVLPKRGGGYTRQEIEEEDDDDDDDYKPSSNYVKKDDNKGNTNKRQDNYYNNTSNKYNRDDDDDDDEDDGDTNAFSQSALRAHNKYRAKHHVSSLRINNDLTKIAQKYADYLARNDIFEHSDNEYKGDPLGENLFMCGGVKITGEKMTDAWYEEVKDYNWGNPERQRSTVGHFTQLVWKDSNQVGFGYAKSRTGKYYGVANYYPAGNYQGEFGDNVKRA